MYYYSAKNLAFYPAEMMGEYMTAKTWPEDAIEVSESIFKDFLTPPEGKERGSDIDGRPCWINKAPLTSEQLIAIAEQKKLTLLKEAQEKISLWQTELQLEIISNNDKNKLIEWLDYIKSLQSIDVSSTSFIKWPQAPKN